MKQQSNSNYWRHHTSILNVVIVQVIQSHWHIEVGKVHVFLCETAGEMFRQQDEMVGPHYEKTNQ